MGWLLLFLFGGIAGLATSRATRPREPRRLLWVVVAIPALICVYVAASGLE